MMIINALPVSPTQLGVEGRFQKTSAQVVNEVLPSEQRPRIELTPSSAQNRLQNVFAQLAVENSLRILDTDYAQEQSQLTKNQILQQAGVAMLSQANAQPQAVLSLLGR
ncbi:flagellin [Hyphomicrobium sp.]|uniref:flagellin n=1 Tax=Hyphomicrobium sp. TaxID=82 RepID=UPI003F700A67